jgi:hypothetical protein
LASFLTGGGTLLILIVEWVLHRFRKTENKTLLSERNISKVFAFFKGFTTAEYMASLILFIFSGFTSAVSALYCAYLLRARSLMIRKRPVRPIFFS